jgi:hypothetical protein
MHTVIVRRQANAAQFHGRRIEAGDAGVHEGSPVQKHLQHARTACQGQEQVNALRADFSRPSRAWRSSHLALKTVLSALAVSWAFPHLHQFQRLVGYLGGDHNARA